VRSIFVRFFQVFLSKSSVNYGYG